MSYTTHDLMVLHKSGNYVLSKNAKKISWKWGWISPLPTAVHNAWVDVASTPERVGEQVRDTVQASGEVAKDTAKVVGNEVRGAIDHADKTWDENIKDLDKMVQGNIKEWGSTNDATVDNAANQAKGVVDYAATTTDDTANKIMDSAQRRINSYLVPGIGAVAGAGIAGVLAWLFDRKKKKGVRNTPIAAWSLLGAAAGGIGTHLLYTKYRDKIDNMMS